jgi:hypothetical protein
MTGRRRRPNAFARARAERARRREGAAATTTGAPRPERATADSVWRDDTAVFAAVSPGDETQVIPAVRLGDETQVIPRIPREDAAAHGAAAAAHRDFWDEDGRDADRPASSGARRGRSEARRERVPRVEAEPAVARMEDSGAARRPRPDARTEPADRTPRPLYAKALFLRNIDPSPIMCFVFFEGAIALGVALWLAELGEWWAAVLLPITVAAMVKLNDVLAGRTGRRAGRVPARPAEQRPERSEPRPSDPVKDAHLEWRRGMRSDLSGPGLPREAAAEEYRHGRQTPGDW